MLFGARLRDGIHDGSVTVIFRRWQRSQVLAGGRYRTGRDMIEVSQVDIVAPAAITAGEAEQAGYPSAAALLADLRGPEDRPVFRILLRRPAEADPLDTLAAAGTVSKSERAEIGTRLDRLDQVSPHGPWTRATLALIDRSPGSAASGLAQELGLPVAVFKRDVRKLKALGLTISLQAGHRISPRGAGYLSSG